MSTTRGLTPDRIPEVELDAALDRAFWEFMTSREELRRHFVPDEGHAASTTPPVAR